MHKRSPENGLTEKKTYFLSLLCWNFLKLPGTKKQPPMKVHKLLMCPTSAFTGEPRTGKEPTVWRLWATLEEEELSGAAR